MISPQRSALLHTSIIIDGDTQYAVADHHGQVWVGATRAGDGDVCISGDADGFERMAAAFMLAATELREAALVEALDGAA